MKSTIRVRIIVVLTVIGGVSAILQLVPVLNRGVQVLDDAILPVHGRTGGHVITLILGVSFLYLAGQLRRRKRRAWELTVVLYAVSDVVHALKGPNVLSAAYAALMLVLLLWSRREFTAKSDPPTYFKLVWFVPTYVLIVYGYGMVTLFLERNRMTPEFNLVDAFATVTKGLIGLDGNFAYEDGLFRRVFPVTLVALGIFGLIALAYLIFRPIVDQPDPDPAELEHATRLVHAYGWDTLAYFALRDDKSYFFCSDGEAFIAYTYLGRTALV